MIERLQERLQLWQRRLQRHPRRVVAALGVLLLGTGITAFGTDPLDAALDRLPQRELVEAVPVAFTPADTETPTAPFILYRTDTTRRDDTLATLLQRLGVSDAQAAEDRKSTRLNSSHIQKSRMPSSA